MSGRDVEGDAQSVRLMVEVLAEEAPVLSAVARRDLMGAFEVLGVMVAVPRRVVCRGHAQALATRDLGASLGVRVDVDGVDAVQVVADPMVACLFEVAAAEKGLVSRETAAGVS